MPIAEIARITIAALEALARDEAGGTGRLYEREAGEKFAGFFRALIASTADFSVSGDEWPDIAASLLAAEIVKPAAGGDGRVAIWGTLEARLQTVGHAGRRRAQRGQLAAAGAVRPVHVADDEGRDGARAAGAADRACGA